LVLLAVVLIVALVSVALLGFFPGMASDAQLTQSQTYWRSAQPIAITEWAAANFNTYALSGIYMRFRNNGAYPLRITKIIGADGIVVSQVGCNGWTGTQAWGWCVLSDNLYLAPGAEDWIGTTVISGLPYTREVWAAASGGSNRLGGLTSVCQNSTSAPGTLVAPSVIIEYIEYLDNNQQITKREVGTKPMIIKCLPTQ